MNPLVKRIAQQHQEKGSITGLQKVLVCLQAQHISYWTSHWQARGPTAYSDHLLFERLYNGVREEIDALAEKLVAMYGGEHVSAGFLGVHLSSCLKRFEDVEDAVDRGLFSEEALLELIEQAYDQLEDSGGLTMGMDDLLMTIADSHETHIYLLQQRQASN